MNKKISDSLYEQARIIPVSSPNRVKTVTKLENGNLRVEQHSGNVFEVKKEDEEFQVFIIYMILNSDA